MYTENNKAKQVAIIGHNGAELNVDANGNISSSIVESLAPSGWDYFDLTYVSSGNGVGEIETITYYNSDNDQLRLITLTYNASNNITRVAKS